MTAHTALRSADWCYAGLTGLTVALVSSGIHESVVVPGHTTHTSATEPASSARRDT